MGAHTGGGGTVILGLFVKQNFERSRGDTCPLAPPDPRLLGACQWGRRCGSNGN